ncbi:MAG: hypothetical protein IKQ89_04905 [Muribaculaceae bacterium]|nr:hypothetical protein [Muribaculaceae bacterium]
MKTPPNFSESFHYLLEGKFHCPKYIESICDILDYLVWLRVNGYEGGYYCESMDEDENHRIIVHQTNAMYDCVMDTCFPGQDRSEFENQGVYIISCLDEWVDSLFESHYDLQRKQKEHIEQIMRKE